MWAVIISVLIVALNYKLTRFQVISNPYPGLFFIDLRCTVCCCALALPNQRPQAQQRDNEFWTYYALGYSYFQDSQ